ncbi:MAG: nuclear transport factor 2 family protein [Firmicutes bacterium]|nr:nuclear transport factor 2 family protein [Bacillota bacterium]
MEQKVLETSRAFWNALEKADVKGMEAICDPSVVFVHIGVTCGLEEEMRCFTEKIFVPTDITIRSSQARVYGETAVVINDLDYGLLLGGNPTTHHFAVTEVYIHQPDDSWKQVQLSFTALVY